MENEELRERALALFEKSDKPLDVNHIANTLNLSWWTAYKLVAEIIFDELRGEPEVLARLSFIPIKSTKSLLIFPRHLLLTKDKKEPSPNRTQIGGTRPREPQTTKLGGFV